MANKIDITIKAKDEASGVIDDINDSFGGLGEGAEDAEKVTSDALGDIFDSAMDAFVGINQGVELAIKAFDLLKGAYEGTVGKVLDIAGEVEELVRVSGDAPENMSALRLEAEKADVPFDDLYKAMENLNDNGVAPTLENLGKIAEEYGKLEDPIEKARYLTEQFGEYGDDIAPMLEGIAGGVTAVADSPVIFTEEELQAVKDHEEAVASLKLAWEGFVITIGQSVIPALTDFIGEFQNSITSFGLLGDYIGLLNEKFSEDKDWKAYIKGIGEVMNINLATAEGIEQLEEKVSSLDEALYGEERAAGAVAAAHDDLVMSIFNGSDSWSNFQQAMEEAGLSTGMLTEEIYNQEKAAVEAADSINNTKIVPKMVEIDVNDGPSKEKIEQLRQMGIEDKEFTVKAEVDDSAVRDYTPPNKTGTITYLPVKGGIVAAGGAIHAAASGLAASLSSYWVGERGPEPFFPAIDGRIVSNTQAMAALRGGAGANAREIANAVRDGVREAMRDERVGNVYNLTMPTSSNPADVRTAFELMEAWGA